VHSVVQLSFLSGFFRAFRGAVLFSFRFVPWIPRCSSLFFPVSSAHSVVQFSFLSGFFRAFRG
jgi:hypothetical protein